MIKNFDTEKLTPEQNAVIESILKMQNAERNPPPKKRILYLKPYNGDMYFYIDGSYSVVQSIWSSGDAYCEKRYKVGNCFYSEDAAMFVAEKMKVIAELRRFADEYNDPIVWNRETQKYEIICYYNSGEADIHISSTYYVRTSNIYFSSKEIAQAAINEIGKDRILKYYFEVKEKTE